MCTISWAFSLVNVLVPIDAWGNCLTELEGEEMVWSLLGLSKQRPNSSQGPRLGTPSRLCWTWVGCAPLCPTQKPLTLIGRSNKYQYKVPCSSHGDQTAKLVLDFLDLQKWGLRPCFCSFVHLFIGMVEISFYKTLTRDLQWVHFSSLPSCCCCFCHCFSMKGPQVSHSLVMRLVGHISWAVLPLGFTVISCDGSSKPWYHCCHGRRWSQICGGVLNLRGRIKGRGSG